MLTNKNINYVHFDLIDSTSTWAKKNAHVLDHHGFTCITAEEQTHGKGCHGRRWISPKGQNIYATLFFCLPKNFPFVANLGQVMSISCSSILRKMGFAANLKWPNDILIEGKKIAGVLCETTKVDDVLGIALSVGININMTEELLSLIDQPAISLAQLSTRTWQIEQVLSPLLAEFIENLEILKIEGFAPFQKTYEALLIVKEHSISFKEGKELMQGQYHSISKEGQLRVTLPNGSITSLTSSEISL